MCYEETQVGAISVEGKIDQYSFSLRKKLVTACPVYTPTVYTTKHIHPGVELVYLKYM